MKKSYLRVFALTLLSVLLFTTTDVFAGTAYTNGRAFLKQGSPNGGGKVYVASNATEPTSGQYKAVTSSTSPAFNVQVAGDATFHYWAVANPGYIFTGWYTAEGALQSSGAAHISKKVTAGQAGGSDTHAYADFYASFIKQIQLSFVVPTNGSFTITHCGSEVTPAYSSFTTEGKVVLTALPADGYKLRGWYTTTNGGVTKNYFAFGPSCEPNFTSNVTIGAEFVPDDGKATFWIKGTNQIYNDLGTANTNAASSSSKLIVVVSDGVVGAGTYTISSGVTLLIPYEETYNLMTTPNIKHIPSPNAASKVTSIFRKLTLASGATINVSGNICIGGSIASCNGGSPSSFPTGAVGMLDLSRGGTINLASGSNLYAWGYVKGQDMDQGNNTAASGVGEINAASGATVWEDYQVGEWRGGTASSTIYNNKGDWKFFPFQSYSVQNIEAPVNYASGSSCKCYWTIFGNGTTYDVNFPLIASSNSLFKLATGGTVRKWYDPTTDHVCFELGGTAALDALTLKVMDQTVTSSDYYLPIPANLKIILKSGNTLTVSKPMTMHAGSVVEVKSGARLNVNSKVFLYDADDWDTYCMYAYYYRTYYSPSLHFNRGEGTAKTTLEDATVIVDGTVDVKGAYLYSSAHGSNICGNGGGTFIYSTLPSNTTMTQCKVLKDNVSVNIRSANLHNDNGTYTKGIASTTFKNVNGRWFTNAKSTPNANHTYDFTYIKSGDVYGTGGTDAPVKAVYSKDKTGLELQDKWANVKTDACDNWWAGIDDSHLYNWTRNSAWHQYIKTGTIGSGDEAIDVYAGSDGTMLNKKDCDIVEAGSIDGNCLYTVDAVKKALVNGSFVAVTANDSPDHGYHATASATTYYLCFDGCVWHPATRNAENLYTVDGTKYIWYGDKWMAVEYDSGVSLHYSLSATNVKIYYDYVDHVWVLATPVAEVVTSAGTEQVFSLANAITKAKAGGTNVTIRLLKNISGTISYDGTNNCGLDLNGFTLSSSTSGMITVNSATTTFIIKDQSAAGTGKVQLSYSANTRRYAVSVTKGHLVVNSGTISAINTSAYASGNTSVDVGAITVANGHKVTVNGGSIEAISDHNPYGIYLAGATAMATINGGTIEAKTTERSSSVDSPYGIIGAGSIYVNGGTVKATCYRSSSSRGISSSGTFTMTGGSVIATASSTCYGVYAASGSNTTISGGTVTSTTTGGTARALISYATATVSGGTLTATAGGSDAKGIYVAGGTTTVNTGATVSASATTNAYGIYYADGTPTVTVNGGAFTVSTTSTTGAYGVYAAKGTGTINDGTFTVTAKTTGAEGMHVETTNTPQLTLNGGKFMVKNSNGSAAGTINNTGATLANFAMAGGYFNVAPNGTTNIAAGKTVKDLDATVEASLISAGYTKKIAGNEYTVTWKSYNGNTTLKTEKVESGKVPVWTGAIPDQSTSTITREVDGWCTEKKNGGTNYATGTPLPAIAASDVTYFVHVKTIYAEVIANGTTTRYSTISGSSGPWAAAMKYTNATIRILSNYGTEADGGKCKQLLFDPANANSIITFDLNGHSWVHGNHGTASENKDVFLNVSPSKANCKLIVTDNSASGNGYLMNKQALTSNLICAYVGAGELLLQGGALKVNNTSATNNAVGVQTSGTGVFNMTGGLIESKKDDEAVTGGTASGVYAYAATNISGGTIRATNAKAQAIGVHMMRNTFTTYLSDDVHVITNGSQSYGVYGYGTVEVSGGIYDVTAEKVSPATWSTARGVYMLQNSSTYFGKATIKGDPVFNVTGVSGAAYGVYSYNNAEVETVIESGTFNISTTNAGTAVGATAQDQATTTVKGGTFNISIPNASYEGCFGIQTQAGGIVNVEGGTFTMTPAKVGGNNDCVRCTGDDNSQLNISGGTFTSTNGAYCVRCFTGTTRISGNPVFSARNGIDLATWAVLSGDHTVTAIVDGGTFIATVGKAINSTTSTRTISDVESTVTGDLTIWDGKFYSASDQPVNSSCGTSYLKIRGGYYSTYTSSNVSNLTKYVVSPSTTEAYATTIDGRAYTYRVNTKYNVTWSVNGNTTVQEYNRNETPNYGSTPTISDGNTYEFLGWNTAVDGSGDTIASVTTDVTYYAVFRKWEAEVIEGEAATGTKFESFRNAFAIAQNMPVAKIKILSNVYYSSSLTLNPDSVAGSKPLTIDLNNHIVNYTKTDNSFALTINKAGCKLIIDDSSVAKNGQFGHRITATTATAIRAIYLQNGEMELRNGTIIAQNNNNDGASGTGTRAVTGSAGTVFTMTGGKLYAKSRLDARAFNSDGAAIFNATGGTIEATNEYTDSGTKWGSNAYGVVLWNNGTFNMSGTATMSIHSGAGALGVYPYGANAVANITGGSINCLAEVNTARCVQAINSGRANISGGDFTANGPDSGSNYNIETISVQGAPGGVVNISGGTFHSDHGSPRAGVRVFGGTVNISGNPYFTTYNGICVGDWATAETISATAYVNGGTFVCPGYALYARESTNKYSGDLNGTVTGTMYVNGGYFKSTGSTICSTSSQAGRLILNGGYYSESAGTTQKTNITTYKGATTEVSTLSPVVHDAYSHDYHYQLLTDFDITWVGGDSYSKVTTLKSGTTPTNTDLDGKCFIRNDSAFYFTGWSPTPSTVVGNTTYNAVGDYYEAEVKIGSGAWTRYTDFLEAWDVVQENANCTIRLLSNFTLADKILYKPTVANARTVFDLNNFTMTIGGTSTSGIDFNKADAVLTITDGSSAKGGKISMTRNTTSSTYTIYIYNGELKMAGGKIYVQNNQDKVNSSSWWPAIAVYVSTGTNAKLTMTGGTVESQAAYLAYALYNYGTTNISGGTVRANATATGNSLGIYAVNGTATISGGTFNITASSTAVAATATGFINNTGTVCNNGTLNITGGTFNVSATNQSAWALSTNGTGKTISGTVYKAHGVINVSGGTFNVSCPAATATQVFAVQCNGWRLFDGATPHAMVAEELSEMNISGGTFTVDTRNSGAWLDNGGNVDLLRCWGSLNVSGGTFTIYQYKTPNAIQVYRGKATVSGNPVFNVYSHTANARGITAAGWTHNDYCDKDATKNIAEAEINGGTFKIITEGQNTEGFLASGITSDGGYAMNAKITVNGGTFLTICPNASGHYPIMLSSAADRVGTYGTATSEIYVNGGRFKSRKGTEADNTSSGAVNAHNATGKIWLTGGYYETNAQLSARVADTCLVTTLTSAEMDPEYANGYRYRIDVHYVAQVTATGVDRKFATLKGALDYAKTLANSTVTLLNDCNFETDGIYGYALGATGKTMTIDLNNHTVNATNSVTSYDRVFGASGQITVTDNSVAKGGKMNLTKNHNGTFIGIVLNDACQLTLANGTIYVENEMASKSATAINIWGTTGIFRQTGGTLQVKATSGLAEGIHMRGTANISGGNVIATSVGNNARAFAQDADAANSKYSSLTVSGTPTITVSGASEVSGVYSNIANTSATISGGTWNISSTSSGAHGVRLSKASASASISGGTFNVTTTTTSAYCVYATTSASATVTGGTFNVTATTTNAYGIYVSGGGSGTVSGGTFTSRTGANKNESFGAFATGTGTTLDITGGTFDVNSADNAGGNINVVRVQPGATATISGGTFRSGANSGYGLVAFGGVTTVSGTALFEAYTGAYVGSWYQGDGTNDELATVNLNGGTFNVKGVAINATWNTKYDSSTKTYLESPFVNSIINVNGGRYKTTGGTIVQKKADGADGGTAVLNITGGYFNEKSSTTHRDQIAGFVADTCKITDITSADIDPEYANGYRYRIDVDYRVKVTHGAVEKKFLNLNEAFEYAKAQTNPTITLIGDANFTGPYSLNPTVANWQGMLDLNNFTITSLQSASFADRYFTLNRSDIKLTVTDNSGAKGGVWNIVGAGVTQSYMIGIVVGLGELELAGGKIYVENNNASQSVTGINTWCSTINKAFYTQTGGILEAKSAKSATALTIYGATTISGGEVKATTTSGATARAFTLGVHDGIIGALTISGNPTITVNTATSDAHGIYSSTNGATATVSGGTFNITSGTTNAFGVYLQTNPSTITISDGTFNITTSGSGCRGLYLESGNGTINVSGGTFNVTTATSGSESWYNIEGMRITYGTGTINCTGGTFNITNHSKTTSAVGARTFAGTVNLSGTVEMNATQCFRISDTYISEVTAYVNISGGTFNSVSSVIYAKNTEGTGGNAGKYTSSDFTITGGKFKTTGANHIDAATPTSVLHLQGGYFTERSGTNSRNNLVTYVSDPYEVIDLDTDDAEYIAGYRYTVANAPVAKVKVGSTITYYTTVLTALNYAKTVANPTITILKDAPLTARWILSDAIANWHGILDLNGKTVTGTGTSYGIVDVTKAGTQLTIRDSSPGAAGKLTHEESQASHWGINVNNGATLVLESGTIYVKNSKADVTGYTTGVCVNSAGGTYTQTGGKVEVHAAKNVKGVYLYGGSATISGGEIEVATDLDPENLGGNAMAVTQEAASSLIINGTASLSATAASYAYGLYQNVASQTATIGGSATIEAHAATYARGVGQLNASTINIQGNADIQAEATTSDAYGVYQEKGATNVSASPSITVSAPTKAWAFCLKNSGTTLDVAGTGTFNATTTSGNSAYAINLTNSSRATVSGGTFNATSANESAYGVLSQSSAEATVSGGSFTCRTAAGKQMAVGAYVDGGTVNISGGSFDINSANNVGNNLLLVRVNKNSTVNISGGTFTTAANYGTAIRAFNGTTTISGNPVFTAQTGVDVSGYIGTAVAGTTTATVTISGGTFNIGTGYVISASWAVKSDETINSAVTVNGGHFKSTGSNMIYKKADGDGTAALTINGGYFNEKATGTDYRTQVNNNVGSGKEVIDLETDDAEYIAGYRYVVLNAPVAKVKVGTTTTYYTTVADAFTAANAATSASTITMLKDATATSYLHYTGSQNCTLDLNGHTISYDGTTTEHRLLRINHADITFTVTDNTVSKEGKLLFNTSKAATSYGVVVIAGNFQLDAGTIEMHASGGTAEGVTPYNSGTSVTINGGKVYVVTTNSQPGYCAYSKKGTTTINGGTIQVEAAGAGYGIYYSAGTTTVTDGKFNISGSTAYATNLSSANANMIIQGGWYNTNTNLKPNAPYQVLSLAGQSPYLYEVAEAYTLTWNLDGGEEATAGTPAGYVKVGAALTAPTVTKTGYTFSAWTPAVAATMPAANTTYTATWTRVNYTISYDLAGGSVASPNPTSYNVESGAITLNNPTKTNYVFAGWTGTGLAEPTTTVTISAGSTGNRSYTATWTPAVASVTIGGGTPDYFTTLQEALTFAQGKTNPTVTVLSDISGLTERLEHSGSTSCTLDLNGHTVAGTANVLLYINYSSSSTKFIIKNTGGSENGKLSLEPSTAAHSYGVYVNKGTLQLEAGTIYLNYTQSSKTAYGVYIRNSRSFTMNGGKVHVVTTSRPTYGVLTFGTTKINGGAIQVEAGSGTGYGIDATNGNTTVKSPADIDVTGATAYGVRVGGYAAAGDYNGTLTIEGGTFDVTASNGAAIGVSVYKGETTDDGGTTYHNAGTANISGGTFTVNASKAGKEACGVFVAAALADPEAIPAATITGGQFNVTAKTAANAYAVNTDAANTALRIEGGWYNTKKMSDGNNMETKYTAPTKDCNYRVFNLEGQSPYLYEVAEAYQLTWDLNGGTVTTAGTMAPVDATGTPSGYVKPGASITAPVIARDGYTFASWSPTVAATMPSANTTYTATWENVVTGSPLDIVDWTASTLTINANGWTASGWPYTINGVVYAKEARAADRTLTIPYSGEAGTDLWITVESGGAITNKNSYTIPFIGTTSGTTASSIVYVNEGTLNINASSTPSLAALYICPGASVNVTNGTLTVGKLVLRTLPWQSGAISGNFTTTETWYTRIAPNKRTITGPYWDITYESASYYQFALPRNTTAKVKDIQVSNGANTPYGTTWLLKRYDEPTRAEKGGSADNWVALGNEEYIQGGVGYEMSSNSNYYREFYFPLGAVSSASLGNTTAVSYDLDAAGEKHAGWNIVASPLMSIYDNSGADPEEGIKVSWLMTDGSYDQGIPEYIYPAIPFSYQASKTGTISFAGPALAALAPRHRAAAEDESVRKQWIHLDVKDGNGLGDHTSILTHPTRYEDAYKTGIDVEKQSLTSSRALIYSSHVYGDMAFAGVADSLLERGVALTVYSPAELELTISMRENAWLDRMEYVYLVDHETEVRTDLLTSDYSFTATAGTISGRFTIEGRFRAPEISTSISNTETGYRIYSESGAIALSGVEAGTQVYVFDAVGHMLYCGKSNGTDIRIPAPTVGVYMLQMGGKTEKMVIGK